MSNFTDVIKYWVCPEIDKATEDEIDRLNITNVHYTSLAVFIVQLISIIAYVVSSISTFMLQKAVYPLIGIAPGMLLCLASFLISGSAMKGRLFGKLSHTKVNIFIGVFFSLLLLWGMSVSLRNYQNGEQMITFYTVEIAVVLFVRLRPVFTTSMIYGSFAMFFIYLNFFVEEGKINPYSFFMLATFTVAGSLINYRLTVSYIVQKNKAEQLNSSLEYIASHDSVTRLQNRYAFTHDLPNYLNCPLCLAMIDINSFKRVNDTLGHKTGDDILSRFSNLLSEQFPHENIYRYGGDEFLVVSPGQTKEQIDERLRAVNEKFSAIRLGGYDGIFTCSYGFAEGAPGSSYDFIDLVMAADKNLYAEKARFKTSPNGKHGGAQTYQGSLFDRK